MQNITMSNNGEKALFQTASRIALLENTVKNQDREIEEMKRTHKELVKDLGDFKKNLYGKIDEIKSEMHKMALSNQLVAINNQRWMIGLLIGFIAQTAVGVFLLIINKGGI